MHGRVQPFNTCGKRTRDLNSSANKMASSSNQVIIDHIQRYLKYIRSTKLYMYYACVKFKYIYVCICFRILHPKNTTGGLRGDLTSETCTFFNQRCSICMGVEGKNCHGKGLQDLALKVEGPWGPWDKGIRGSLPWNTVPDCQPVSPQLSTLRPGRVPKQPRKTKCMQIYVEYMYQRIICIQKTLLKETI